MLLVRKVDGPATARVGDRVTYRATEFNRVNPTEDEKRGINWLIECEGEDFRRENNVGDVFTLEITDILVGKTIVAKPFANQPSSAVSVFTLIQPEPKQRLREEWGTIRTEYTDILIDNVAGFSEQELVRRIKSLADDLDDLIDSIGPIERDEGDDQEPELTPPEARRLAIIVGHTLRKQGAAALPPIHQNEYPFNTEIARRVELAAANHGMVARTFFRDGVGIQGAYQTAAAFDPDAIIELHFNAAENPAAKGTETLYGEVNPDSRRLAGLVQDSMVSVFGRSGSANRGIKVRRPGDRGFTSVTAAPTVPSVLVEPFFGSNAGDCHLAREKVQEYAEGLVGAFVKFTT
jgi:N-acetylmuramoyl-L-alanine amidase